MSIDQRARSNNQKLFDAYAKKLCSDDVRTFSEVAEKLAIWLDNGKAYYDEARPEVWFSIGNGTERHLAQTFADCEAAHGIRILPCRQCYY